MKPYFYINLEFDHDVLENTINDTSLAGKGYCCFVDSTSLTMTYRNEKFKTILNKALVNSCDGSYIAMMASKIHKAELKEYIGPDFFTKFVYKRYKQIIIGSNEAIYRKILEKLVRDGVDISNYCYISLPFVTVEHFNYKEIAKVINQFEPRFIWVSLGAPKQETFMSYLEPHIYKGVMIGVGAALNYFTGEIQEIPNWARKTHLIWLHRIIAEPKKQIRRCLNIIRVLPRMYLEEKGV